MSEHKDKKQDKKEAGSLNKAKNEPVEEHYTIDYEDIEPDRVNRMDKIDRIIAKMGMGENLSFFD